jgi:hypothetical protein
MRAGRAWEESRKSKLDETRFEKEGLGGFDGNICTPDGA